MKLKKLIRSNSWLSVATILLQLYPDEEKNTINFKIIIFAL